MNGQSVVPSEFVTMSQAAAWLNTHPKKIRRAIRECGVAVYHDRIDRRRRLLRRDDVELLRTPVPEEAPIAHAS